MTGRGIDQILQSPPDPKLKEPFVKSALDYVEMAERVNGPIMKPVSYSYVWGAALEELARVSPALRFINLETSITTSEDWFLKGINYRMHPRHIELLKAAGVDGCMLANNHILDFGNSGLSETLECLNAIGIRHAGAGMDRTSAEEPASFVLESGKRVLAFAFGVESSGIPESWAARADRAGVNYVANLSASSREHVSRVIGRHRKEGDLVILSIHWGGNWGYGITPEEREFARSLVVDAGVDVFWGHSSHHPKAFEICEGRPIFYGCGDLINDYEGIQGFEEYRADLSLMYFLEFDEASNWIHSIELVPVRIKGLALQRPTRDEVIWLKNVLNREGAWLGTELEIDETASKTKSRLRWRRPLLLAEL